MAGAPAMQASAFLFFMPYSKPYKTLEEQRGLLEARGMIIGDSDKAEEYLRRIGYYRLSAYWYPFRTLLQRSDGGFELNNRFKAGTTFEHATELYAFDKTLRLLTLDAIERIEISVRTEIALAIGIHDPWAHRDPARLDNRFTTPRQGFATSKSEVWLNKLDERTATSKEEFATHFRTKYVGENMPIWMAVELLDFGPLSVFLSGMRYSDLKTISASYGNLRPHLIKSWVRSLVVVRNTCAHHSRLWNKPLVDQPALPKPGERPELDHLIQPRPGNRRLYAAFAVMQILLKEINPRTKWADRLKAHMATFPQAPNIALSDAGFPDRWETLPLWN